MKYGAGSAFFAWASSLIARFTSSPSASNPTGFAAPPPTNGSARSTRTAPAGPPAPDAPAITPAPTTGRAGAFAHPLPTTASQGQANAHQAVLFIMCALLYKTGAPTAFSGDQVEVVPANPAGGEGPACAGTRGSARAPGWPQPPACDRTGRTAPSAGPQPPARSPGKRRAIGRRGARRDRSCRRSSGLPRCRARRRPAARAVRSSGAAPTDAALS